MDLYQFFSSLVASLAWPTCVLCVILCFRKQLTLWAERLYSLKYKGLEVILSMEAVAKQAEKAGVIPLLDNDTVPERSPEELIDSAMRLTEDNPEAAIIIAWQAVELTIVKKFLLRFFATFAVVPVPPKGSSIKSPMFELAFIIVSKIFSGIWQG